MGAWADHVAKWKDCTRCALCHQRDRIVLARAGVAGGPTTGGSLPCQVLFIGQAPGSSENAVGLPFWGPAGDLMQQIIDRALPPGVTYALTNIVACFPGKKLMGGDEEPSYNEIIACRPRLVEFISIARPKLVIRIGRPAQDFVEHDANGKICGAMVEDIIHPASILKREMPLAQKGMAVNKMVVTVKCAVEDMLAKIDQLQFKVPDANNEPRQYNRESDSREVYPLWSRHATPEDDQDIPF